MLVDVKKLVRNPNNPRIIKDDKFKLLIKSIIDFPEMLDLRPIIVDINMMVLGGNMRLQACIEAGIKEVPILIADKLTEEQKKKFIIKDNVGFGEWNWDVLNNEWDTEKLEEWGLDVPIFESSDQDISENIHEVYKIEVSCVDETDQEKKYNELISKGYNCRLLNL